MQVYVNKYDDKNGYDVTLHKHKKDADIEFSEYLKLEMATGGTDLSKKTAIEIIEWWIKEGGDRAQDCEVFSHQEVHNI